MDIKGNTVLITGGATGIGFEIAKKFTELNNTVIITGRDMEKLMKAKELLHNVNIYQCDVNSSNSIAEFKDKIIDDFPNLNILVNNAGIMKEINLLNTDFSDVCSEIDTNLNGTIKMTQCFLPHFLKIQDAAIINISSGLAFLPFDKAPIYSVSKSGVHTYTKLLRKQLSKTNIKVFELIPPKTTVPMFSENNKIPMLDVQKVVDSMIKFLEIDKLEIKPGLSRVMKFFGRIAL